jgi:hypothetical protein
MEHEMKVSFVSLMLVFFHVHSNALAQTEVGSKVLSNIDTRWVHGSWVNVRSDSSISSKVIGNWTTNTKISTIETRGDWCLAVAANNLKGFVACELIGATPLTLEMLAIQELKDGNQQEARRFWVSPSIARFQAVGRSLNYSTLSPEQAARQEKLQQPVRFPLSEFDGMKARLQNGFVPSFDQELSRLAVREIGGLLAASKSKGNSDESNALAVLQSAAASLPPIKPSLFKRQADVTTIYEGSVDALIAMQGASPSIQFQGKARWTQGHHSAGPASYWDVGSIKVTFARPIIMHSVGRNGLMGAQSIHTMTLADNPNEGCKGGYSDLPVGKPIDGYPRQKGRSFLNFYVPSVLANKLLQIDTRKRPRLDVKESPDAPAPPKFSMIHGIDLDSDGIADFAINEWTRLGEVSGSNVTLRNYFVNISGQWFVAGLETQEECT